MSATSYMVSTLKCVSHFKSSHYQSEIHQRSGNSAPIGIALLHVSSELDDWHPAVGRDMNSTDDLDMALHDTVTTYCPPEIGPRAILYPLLREKEPNQ